MKKVGQAGAGNYLLSSTMTKKLQQEAGGRVFESKGRRRGSKTGRAILCLGNGYGILKLYAKGVKDRCEKGNDVPCGLPIL